MLRAIEGEKRARRGVMAKASLAWLCENCEMPTSIVHVGQDGERLCGECARSIAAIKEALATYRHNELRERIRVQRVLASEGIAGYGR